MKSKALYFMRRAFAVLLVMAMIWSDTSIVSLAQTTASDDGTQQSEEPSSEPPVSASSEQTIVPEKETDGEAVTPTEEPTEEPAEPTEEPIEPAEEPTEPAEPESPEPSDAPLETPPLETLTPTATPAEMSPEMSVDLKASPNEEEPYVLRIGRTDTDDYNPESDMQIASDVEGAIIYICEKDSAVMLDESSVQEIKWYRAAQDEEFDLDADPCQTGACFFLNIEFFLVESRLRAVIKVSEDEQYELDVNHIQPGTCTSGQGALEGVLLPDHYIKIVGAEGSIFVDHSIFFRADDSNGANAEPISDGAAIGYCLAEEDNGKYIFARYGAWNDTEHKLDYYQTQIAGPIGYVVSENEEDWQHNAQLLQSAIDEAENLAAENNQRMQIYVPEGVKLKPAEGSIHFNNSICLYAYDVTLYGGVEVTKAVEFAEVDDGIAQNVVGGVHGLNIVKEGGIAVDAAKAPVWLNECSVSCSNGATMLQVSGDTYGKTAIYDCNVEFDQGGCILKLAAGSKTMPQEFALKNTNLRIQQISEGSTVAMLEYEEDAIDGSVRWNVEGLEPQSEATIKQLSAPENSLINNAFWVEGVNGMIANSGILTMQSVSKKWIHPKLADGTSFAGNDAYKIIVGTPEEYEVCCIPEDIDFAFRPYALTGQYGAGQGSYAKLLPAGFVTYIVIDVNQKEGFPYGALIGKRLEYAGDNYVLMQYYADKSVETVASVIDGEVVQRGDSILEALLKEGDAYRVLVNTEEDGEPVEEPIVLAVYSEMPSAKAGLKVFEEGELSDGQILTDETKKVSFELNGGIAKNYYDGDAFEINTAKCTVPEGSGMPAFEEDMSGSRAVLEIPEGAYGTLVVTAHYKSSVSAKEVKFTYTLQLTSVQNAEGFALDVKNAGGRYYGTATFDVFSGAVKPLLGVSAGKGENGEGDYNLKVTSFTISGSKVTVQYLLDSGDDNAWNDILNPARTPRLLIETVAGTYAISLETTGAEASVADEEIGVTYLFDLETDSESGEKFAVFTGALITDGNKFYPNGDEPRIAVPDKAKIKGENDSETTYDVTAMAEGCLNNIYENGAKAYAPDIVEIPASVTDIRGKLVTDPDYSNLRQIIVADGNPAYKTYGIAVDAAGKSRDDRQYCALYKVNEDHTELVEIASNYVGGLAWRSDAVWTDDTYSCNFSGITDFWCGDDYSGRYQSWDRMLVEVETKEEGDEAAVIKAPEYEIGSSLVLPEGIVTINAKALENVAITTLVLPSTMTEWKDNAVTQAKNIYVYQPDTDINPCEGLDRSLKGITFYGFVDEKQSSALKTWVLAAKGQSYKFVAMKESGETAADYSVKTLRESVVSERGIEYYPVSMGDELTETFDFDFSSKVVNGYPGKTDLTVELEQPGDDAEYMLQEGEFKEDFRDGSRIFEAVKPGVAKVVIKKGDSVIKTAYFVVKPNYCEINESNESEDGTERVDFGDMTFGEMKTLTVTPYYWDKDAGDNVAVTLESAAIQEYDKIGAIASLIPDERAVTGTNGKKYDAWQIELSEGDGLAYNVTPLLYEAENGEVKGGSETEIVLSLFGDRRSVYARAKMKGEEGSENKWLHVDDYNPLIERGETRETLINSYISS